MPIRNIPSQTTKKWQTSFRGDFWGDLINMMNLDLFSSQGKAKVGTKYYPHTTVTDVATINPVSSYVEAKIFDGVDAYPKKVWGVAPGKVIVRSVDNGADPFELDLSTGIPSGDDTGAGSDLVVVPDETEEAIEATEVAVPEGDGGVKITGSGNNTRWAQSFTKVNGPFKELALYIKKVGAPTDNLVIQIQTNNAGAPSGTTLTSLTLNAALFTTSFVLNEYPAEDWSDPTVQLGLDDTYWIVFSRSGSADEDNYVVINANVETEEDDDPYENGTLINYNGSTWGRTLTYKKTDTFTANGSWVCPAGITEITVEAWGGGAGGSTNVGGGGGGAYSRKTVTVVPTTSYNVVVAQAVSANTDGQDSTFDATEVVAKGGLSGTNGGTGGQASAGTGDVKYSGGNGELGTGDRAGGGGAGDSGNGNNGVDLGGQGGEKQGGSGGGDYNGNTVNGGSMYGGGGNSATAAQRAGARGEVRITYNVAATANYANVAERFFGRFTLSGQVDVPVSVLPGDLLLLIVSTDNAATVTASGWTVLTSRISAANQCTQTILWKRATGDDSEQFALSAASSGTYVGYRIINADTPTATTAGMSGDPNPPEHDTFETANYLWIATGTFSVQGSPTNNPTAPPTNYDSFIIETEVYPYDADNILGARTMVAERQLNASAEDPGIFTGGGSSNAVAATIAVPYKAQVQYMDIGMQIQVEFPAAPSRLYLTTKQDVKFLNQEDGVWQSLWQGIFGQDELNADYPHPMKLLEAGGVLFVGDKNKLHTMIATGNNASESTANKLVFPDNYYINWIVTTKNAVFMGLANVLSDDMPSLICYYEPFTEVTRIFTIKEGTTIGYETDENCYIVDRAGQMRYYNGQDFKVFDQFPPYYNQQPMNLMHRNGIVVKNSIVHFLWEGQYPYACGVWTYDEGRLYHRYGFVFDGVNLNSFGAIDPMPSVAWMALEFTDFGMFASAAVRGSNATVVKGIFSDFKRDGVTVEVSNRGYFKTIKFISQGIDNVWQRIFAKYNLRTDGVQEGSIILKQRYQMSAIGEDYNASAFDGTWTSSTTFTCATAQFVTDVDAGNIEVGDEVIVRAGQGAGLLAHIASITGTTTKTVTITEGLGDIASGTFTFSVENWRIIANRGVTGKSSQWVQVKAEIRDYIEVEELQVGSKINRSNEE